MPIAALPIFSKIVLATLLWASCAFSSEFYVKEYFGNDLRSKKVRLENLSSDSAFDGRFFKIVEGKSDRPIEFLSPNAQRAAHVYHHLTQARKYFLGIPGARAERLNKKIVVRLNITNHFNPYSKFSHDDYKKVFNNALTIPASDDQKMGEIEAWNEEIWFRPMREVRSSAASMALAATLENNQRNILSNLAEGFLYSSVSDGIDGEFVSDLADGSEVALLGLGFLFVKSLPSLVQAFGKTFKSRFYLDTAMVPEIIYHEYAHFALGDRLELYSTPVIEGIANYYAGMVSGKARWGNRPRRYSRDVGRNAYSSVQYSFRQEEPGFATSSLVYKMLWSFNDITPLSSALIYRASSNLDRNSNIKKDLIDEIFHQINKLNDKNKLLYKIKFHRLLQRLGL